MCLNITDQRSTNIKKEEKVKKVIIIWINRKRVQNERTSEKREIK